jgi:hypothetical protein
MPARWGPTAAIDQTTKDDHGEAHRRRQARYCRDQINQPAECAEHRALQSRALAAVIVGQPTSIAARQHGCEELDSDHQTDNQIAEA